MQFTENQQFNKIVIYVVYYILQICYRVVHIFYYFIILNVSCVFIVIRRIPKIGHFPQNTHFCLFLPILGKYPIFAYFSHISKNALFCLFSYICDFCPFSLRSKKCPIFTYFLIFFIF